MHESATSDWWKEVRERIQHSLLNFPQGFEQQTVLNLLADQEALELVWNGQIRHAGSAYALLSFGHRLKV